MNNQTQTINKSANSDLKNKWLLKTMHYMLFRENSDYFVYGWELCVHKHSPIWIAISPMAHVALLHTDMNSGLRLTPRTGMNSAGGGKRTTMTNWPAQHTQKQQLAWETGSPTVRLYSVCQRTQLTDAGLHMKETRLCQVSKQSERTLPHFWHGVL